MLRNKPRQRTLTGVPNEAEGFTPCPETDAEWDNLAIESLFSLETMAKKCQLSTRQLRRRSMSSRRGNPSSWMSPLRMVQAAAMVLKKLRTKEIADGLGFKNSSDFCRAFKVFYKVCPKEFYRLYRVAKPAIGPKDRTCPFMEILGCCPVGIPERSRESFAP